MEITKVNVFPFEGKKKSNFKAYASIVFDDVFMVTGLKILDGSKGLFVSMPQVEGKDEEYHDVAFPVTKKFRKELQEAVINAYLGDDEDEDDKKSKKSKKNKKHKEEDKKSKNTKNTKKSRDEDEDDEDEDDEDDF